MSQPAPLEKPLYSAVATAVGGRGGTIKSDDGVLDLQLVMPKGLGGPGTPGTNPEQLFAAGYAACFGNAAMHIARMKKLDAGAVTVVAKVDIGQTSQGFGLQVALTCTVPGLDRAGAQALLDEAHKICPYSNATRGNIVVDIKLAE